ncbi:MAG: hypothetical protein K5877_06770 [Lachnospiraceae bacterium]|nr:hypothetical protein [Lachnospiraceae bacterium]
MQKSKAGLFLMELLIALLFFSIAGAVCLSLFVGAHTTNELSQNLSHASVLLTNYCEDLYSEEITSDSNPNEATVYYNEALMICDPSNASFCLTSSTEKKADFLITHITICDKDKDKTFIEQDIKRYIRRDVSHDSEN